MADETFLRQYHYSLCMSSEMVNSTGYIKDRNPKIPCMTTFYCVLLAKCEQTRDGRSGHENIVSGGDEETRKQQTMSRHTWDGFCGRACLVLCDVLPGAFVPVLLSS